MDDIIKDNKSTKYKDFWINKLTLRIPGILKKPLAYMSIQTGRSQKEIVLRALSNELNKFSLEDNRFKNELVELDDLLKKIYSNNRQPTKNDLAKIIINYSKECFEADKYKDLNDIVDLIKQKIKEKQSNESTLQDKMW